MHLTRLLRFSCIFLFLLSFLVYSQTKPQISYADLILGAERNPSLRTNARELAAKQSLPLSIYLPQGIFIEALGIEKGEPVYSKVTNLVHPLENGEAVFIDEILSSYDLIEARVHYGDRRITNPNLGFPEPTANSDKSANSCLMIPDWTADRVLSFDINNGNLINANFIPSNSPNLQSPKEALLNKFGFITVSDQISDLVQKYDTSGTYLGYFAPTTGVNTAILDNIRGHNYKSNGNLVVCVAAGGNQNSIAEFDLSGNYLGQFITTGSGGISSPFDIIFRANDVLVSTSTASGVYRFTHNGAPINVMVSGLSFVQQIQELSDKRLAVIEFSGTGSGIRLYDSSGTFIRLLNGVTGNRGVYQLRNGNFLTTNGTGVHEIDSASGALVRTVISGASFQYITPFDPSIIIPVELVSFTAEELNGQIKLYWTTATEKNNLGFELERSLNSAQWEKVGFVRGNGTTTQASFYSFTDNNVSKGTNSYRLKQIDYDGSYSYSKTISVDIEAPSRFSLEQNYPNPFNPMTNIQYSIGSRQFVTLKVYDVLGNEVTTLVNEEKDAGFYNQSFDVQNSKIATGVYFYELRAGNFVSAKSMTIIK